MEGQTVDGVDHAPDTLMPRGQPTENPGFGGMGVDDVWLPTADQPAHGKITPQVGHGCDPADQRRYLERLDPAVRLCTLKQGPFRSVDWAVDQRHRVSKPGLPLRGKNGVLLRSAEDQAG